MNRDRGSEVVWHPGTSTFMSMDECVIVNVPNHIEDVERYLEEHFTDFVNGVEK